MSEPVSIVRQEFAYSAPKQGTSRGQCEDQWAVAVDGSAAAVCDGASDAAYSRLWASVLVQRFVEEPTVDIDSQWLQVAVSRFERSLDYLSMPWHLLPEFDN